MNSNPFPPDPKLLETMAEWNRKAHAENPSIFWSFAVSPLYQRMQVWFFWKGVERERERSQQTRSLPE